jgi:hypothetical protein
MTALSQEQQEILNDMLKGTEQSGSLYPMQQHGLTNPDGKSDTESLEQIINRMAEHRKENPIAAPVENQSLMTNLQKPLQKLEAKPKQPTLQETPTALEKVTEILYQCFLTMETYSKQPEDFRTINKMFLSFLADKPPNKVIKAFERYVKERTKFPTIADILGLIEERIKPDKSYYMVLQKQLERGEFLSEKEQKYIKAYERQVLNDWE